MIDRNLSYDGAIPSSNTTMSYSSWDILGPAAISRNVEILENLSLSGHSIETNGSGLLDVSEPAVNEIVCVSAHESPCIENDAVLSSDEKECLISQVLDKFDYSFEPNEEAVPSKYTRTCSCNTSLYLRGSKSMQWRETIFDFAVPRQIRGCMRTNFSKRQLADALWFLAGAVLTMATMETSLWDFDNSPLYYGSI